MVRRLSQAIWEGANQARIVELIELVPWAVTASPVGANTSLLHLAARANNRGAVTTLLKRGADVKLRDPHGRTPIHIAATLGHTGVLTAMLLSQSEDGAREALRAHDETGATPLQLAFDHSHGECHNSQTARIQPADAPSGRAVHGSRLACLQPSVRPTAS